MAGFSKPQSIMTMLFALFVLLQATVAIHGAHHQHQHPRSVHEIEARLEEARSELEKRDNNVAITGVCSSGTNSKGVCNSGRKSFPRQEIRTLQQNSELWNLYLLGLERFKAKDKSDRLSYYAIAGVHGRPYVEWNNQGRLLNTAGYCPHAQTLFGSWHRPYLALFEQALYQNILDVINTFPSGDRERLRGIAAEFRIPYWDWAMDPPNNGPSVPTAIRDQTVTVTKPSGRVSIPNPLYSYTWGSSLPSEMGGGPWSNFATTLRRPVGNPTRSNNNEMNSRFGSLRTSLRNRVFDLFASRANWGQASTSQIGVRTASSGNSVDSYESVHDAIHVTAGGESGGHMYYLDYSSFDPIFWLHHTNVDRLLTMHQYMNTGSWVAPGNINHPMAQWNQGEAKNEGSPLKPFTKDTDGKYFTSIDIKSTLSLGYYYPETKDRNVGDVARAINRLYSYGGRSIATKRGFIGDLVDGVKDFIGQFPGRAFRQGDYHTILSIVANKYALAGSYSVHCFVGKPSSNSTSNSTAPYPVGHNSTTSYNTTGDFTEDPNYVGMYGVLGGTMAGGGNASYPVLTEGALPLTACLQGKEAKGELKSLKPEHVEPYLKENLHYKVIGPDGKELNPDDIPDFHVYVKTAPVTPANGDDELPSYGEYINLPEVTIDLPAGKPWEYVPNPFDIPLPEGYGPSPSGTPSSPSGTAAPIPFPTGVFPYPTLPWEEEGYCMQKQTIEYVDESGNFLYSETS